MDERGDGTGPLLASRKMLLSDEIEGQVGQSPGDDSQIQLIFQPSGRCRTRKESVMM